MARFGIALAALLSMSSTTMTTTLTSSQSSSPGTMMADAFQLPAFSIHSIHHPLQSTTSSTCAATVTRVARRSPFANDHNHRRIQHPWATATASSSAWSTSSQLSMSSSGYSSSGSNANDPQDISDAVVNAANAVSQSLSEAVDDAPDSTELEIAERSQKVQQRIKTYTVTLPLQKGQNRLTQTNALTIGLTLGQIQKGRQFAPQQMSLDTLRIEQIEQVKNADIDNQSTTTTTDGDDDSIMDKAAILRRVDYNFQGVVVVAVEPNSASWKAGVRVGDIVRSTSATLGDAQWPKSTLEGVRSAVSSRRASSIKLEFQRLDGDAVVDNQFELTLTKPLGLELAETGDGFVQVTGFTENAPTLVRYAVKPGDRILAVDASIGDKLWPVSTVEGVISAVTARLPGQQITLRFQRPNLNLADDDGSNATPVVVAAPATSETAINSGSRTNGSATTGTITTEPSTKPSPSELIRRCREILNRYSNEEKQQRKQLMGRAKFVDKYAVRALVADKVMDALASAEATVDAVTLSMIMNAYLSCNKPDGAIRAFESCVGLSSNGSNAIPNNIVVGKGGKHIVATTDSLDVYIVSSLLKAHAQRGDFDTIRRVLAAVEGQSATTIDGLDSIVWPNSGPDGTLRADTQCYNIAISAASTTQTKEGLKAAFKLFQSMNLPSNKNIEIGTPNRDIVSYNTIMNALARAGLYNRALDLFAEMERTGVKPDKFTYTAMIRPIIAHEDSDIQEMLYDMKDRGIEVDVVTYNEIVKVLCERHKVIAAKLIINEMELDGVAPNSITYGLLMSGLLRQGNPAGCVTLFESACADTRTVGLMENVYLYTTAITAASALGDHERAFDLLTRMNALGLKPNLKTLTALMGACLSSGKPDMAADIYRRMEEPDGHAMAQGVRALCMEGSMQEAFDIVAALPRRSSVLKGKHLMRVYGVIIETSLRQGDYDMARRAATDLFEKGNIPSKAMYRDMFEAMNLFPRKRMMLRGEISGQVDPEASDKFRFLLFVLDSVGQRNIPCEGPLYAAILRYGTQLRALPRKISSLIVVARTAGDTVASPSSLILSDEVDRETCSAITWEELLDSYDEYKSSLASPEALPCLQVRIAPKDVSVVLAAEKDISFSRRSR